MARTNNIPQHVKQKIWEEIEQKIPYSTISTKWQVSKASVSRIATENKKQLGIESVKQPISKNEMTRREKIGKAAVTLSAIRKADFITENFLDAFGVIFHNSNHLVEIIDHSRDEADSLKKKQEEILSKFEEFIDQPEEGEEKKQSRYDLNSMIRESIQKINDFFARDMIRIKAVGEMRKHLETFLKLKEEILDLSQVKKIFDAFFGACNSLSDKDYCNYRDKVIELAPATKAFFIRHEGGDELHNVSSSAGEE